MLVAFVVVVVAVAVVVVVAVVGGGGGGGVGGIVVRGVDVVMLCGAAARAANSSGDVLVVASIVGANCVATAMIVAGAPMHECLSARIVLSSVGRASRSINMANTTGEKDGVATT